jgi:hypothetical protein
MFWFERTTISSAAIAIPELYVVSCLLHGTMRRAASPAVQTQGAARVSAALLIRKNFDELLHGIFHDLISEIIGEVFEMNRLVTPILSGYVRTQRTSPLQQRG